MARHRIVSTAPIGQVAIDILEQVADVHVAASPDEDSVLRITDGAIGIVCRGEGKVTARLIEAVPSLRVIGRPGAGFDSVDIAKATSLRIPVVYAPVGGFAVAEGTMALLLALVKKVVLCDGLVKNGQWNKRYELTTGDMTGCTLGLIGLGRIGSHVARLAQSFEMTILGYDPCAGDDFLRQTGVEPVTLQDLLMRSDLVSVHVPLDEQTRGLINRGTVALMKTGAILVNTSRGAVVEDLDVLADALDRGHLSAVGLDVFPVEPPDVSHRIFKHPNFICAPHLSGVSEAAMDRIYRSMATDMVAVLEGRPPKHCVNPTVFD